MAKITYQQRKRLPSSDFVFPKKRKYLIKDASHARNALSRVAAHGTPFQKARVRAVVHKRFPGIKISRKRKATK